MTPQMCARSWYRLHAYETDAAARARLTALMYRVRKHRRICYQCDRGTCRISVRRALKFEAEIDSIVIDLLLAHDQLIGKPGEADRLASFARNSLVRAGVYPAP